MVKHNVPRYVILLFIVNNLFMFNYFIFIYYFSIPDTLKSLETALIRKYLARRRWHRWFNAIKAMNRMKSFSGSVKHEPDENTNEPVEELHSKKKKIQIKVQYIFFLKNNWNLRNFIKRKFG